MLLDQTSPGSEIFTTHDMCRADRLSISAGISSLSLMKNADRAVPKHIIDNWAPGGVAIMSGKGTEVMALWLRVTSLRLVGECVLGFMVKWVQNALW